MYLHADQYMLCVYLFTYYKKHHIKKIVGIAMKIKYELNTLNSLTGSLELCYQAFTVV